MRYLSVFLFILTFSCSSQNKETSTHTLQHWKTNNYTDSVQILLTNEYKIRDSYSFGASSFLIKTKKDTLLCTAKHLLGDAMGIIPEVKTDSFNSLLNYWKAFPRNNTISSDTVFGKTLLNKGINATDIILQKCAIEKHSKIQVLQPRFSKIKKGERLDVIGCEYSDFDCHQKTFSVIMDTYQSGQIWVKSKSKFDASGFSGAPVIDANGYVIGVISAGSEFGNELYLIIEPINKVKQYLN